MDFPAHALHAIFSRPRWFIWYIVLSTDVMYVFCRQTRGQRQHHHLRRPRPRHPAHLPRHPHPRIPPLNPSLLRNQRKAPKSQRPLPATASLFSSSLSRAWARHSLCGGASLRHREQRQPSWRGCRACYRSADLCAACAWTNCCLDDGLTRRRCRMRMTLNSITLSP